MIEMHNVYPCHDDNINKITEKTTMLYLNIHIQIFVIPEKNTSLADTRVADEQQFE